MCTQRPSVPLCAVLYCDDVSSISNTLVNRYIPTIKWFNPPTDRPFETSQNFHFQKCPLVLCTHGDTIWTVLVASCTTIQIHSNGFRGSIDSPLRSIQTRFCISCTTIWKDPNKVLYELTYHSKPFEESTLYSYFTIQNHNSEWFQMVHQLVWKRYQK